MQLVLMHIILTSIFEFPGRKFFFISELRDAVLDDNELGDDWDELHLESLKQIYDQMVENGKKIR